MEFRQGAAEKMALCQEFPISFFHAPIAPLNATNRPAFPVHIPKPASRNNFMRRSSRFQIFFYPEKHFLHTTVHLFHTDENHTNVKKEEFRNLFETYFVEVRKYILYRCGNEDVATDISQDTFLKIWEKQISVDPKTAKGLLFKIAGDLYVSQYRREKLAFNFFSTFKPDHKSTTPEDEIHFQELKMAYEAALKSMPEKQRTVFLMNRIDELKYKEIADQLDLSVKAIEKRMSQALEHLKIHLKDKISGLILFVLRLSLKRIKTETNR